MGFAWSRAEAQICQGADFQAELWNPSPGVIITRLRGTADLECLRFYTRRAEREMRFGPLLVFHDWEGLGRYSPEARDGLKLWGKEHNDAFEAVHYLIRSKIVMMLISVAALALGRDLFATTDRAAFEATLERSLAARKRKRY